MKIDVSKIEGYADMTPDEKIAALESYDAEDNHDGYIKKKLFDKTASELAEAKRQLKAKMTEDEISKQKEQEERAELEAKYNALLRESNISKYKGYDEELADSTAEAMIDGNSEVVFANQQKHLISVEKKLKADILKNTPKPTGDGEAKSMTLEGLKKMSPTERYEFSKINPEEYKSLYTETGGNE